MAQGLLARLLVRFRGAPTTPGAAPRGPGQERTDDVLQTPDEHEQLASLDRGQQDAYLDSGKTSPLDE